MSSPWRAGGVQLFRAPTVLDGNGFPQQIGWEDIRKGDALLAVLFDDLAGIRIILVLQFWHVIEVEDSESFRIEVNNIVGSASDGEYVYDRFAGLLGLPPGER